MAECFPLQGAENSNRRQEYAKDQQESGVTSGKKTRRLQEDAAIATDVKRDLSTGNGKAEQQKLFADEASLRYSI